MKTRLRGWTRRLTALCATAAALSVAGCDTDEDQVFDYVPPAGKGALIVDNKTSTDIGVYLDGISMGEVDDDSDQHFDATPGTHRLVLDEDNGDRQYAADVDILEGRLTVVRVRLSFGIFDSYEASVWIQE